METAVARTVTLFEFSVFFSVIAATIAGATAGARHGAVGLILGGLGGIAIGFISVLVATSPMALVSRLESRGLRANFDALVGSLSLFVLVPLAPVGAGIASWWLIRLF